MELTTNTYMNALLLLFIKSTKLQNGHQKNSPKQETVTHFSNKSDSSIRRIQSYDPKYKYEQENIE